MARPRTPAESPARTVVHELFGPATAGAYAAVVGGTAQTLAAHVAEVDRPFSGITPREALPVVDGVDLDAPLGDTRTAVEELRELYLRHAVWFHDPGYAAHLNCPVVLPALAAEVLVSAVNSSLDTWDQSATGTLIERRLIDWTADRIGFPTGGPTPGERPDGIFTSGGTASNLHALFLAREHADRRGSLPGGPPGGRPDAHAGGARRILATASSHFSVGKAATVLGLGPDAVLEVGADLAGRMDPVALDAALRGARSRGERPVAVVATAGTTDLGLIDPLDAIARVCRDHGVWLHVDAAYGCGLLVSRRHRHRLAGIERADSVTVDFHKSFFQPVSCSAVVVRRALTLQPGTVHADYLNPEGSGLPNQVDKSLQTTRRFDALKLWLTLRTLGADALGDAFDSLLELTAEVHAVITEAPDLEAATAPELSTVLFRFRPPGLDAAAAERLTPVLRRALLEDGAALVAETRHRGSAWLKLTLLNPAVTVADLARVLDAVRATGRRLLAEGVPGPGATSPDPDRADHDRPDPDRAVVLDLDAGLDEEFDDGLDEEFDDDLGDELRRDHRRDLEGVIA